MGKVIASITISLDGYFAGPDDGPGRGLGVGGERLHYWVFGGPLSYDYGPRGEATGEDQAWLDQAMERVGAVIGGRWTYEAAGHWGGANPWGIPFFIVTHRPEDQPEAWRDSNSSTDWKQRSNRRGWRPDPRDINIMGGGDVIRQALVAGMVEEMTIIVAPIVLGGGKRLFDSFDHRVELEQTGVRQSRFATFLDYRVAGREG